MLPSAPYGSSDAVNSVNAVQPLALNPQTPLLPPNFQDPGRMQSPQSPGTGLGGKQSMNTQGQQQWQNFQNSGFAKMFGL